MERRTFIKSTLVVSLLVEAPLSHNQGSQSDDPGLELPDDRDVPAFRYGLRLTPEEFSAL